MMNTEEFCKVGQTIVGPGRGWQTRLAHATGISTATISQIARSQKEPSPKIQRKLMSIAGKGASSNITSIKKEVKESYEDACKRIEKRYRVMDRMVANVANGNFPSLIVSGDPGTGKSYGVRKILEESGTNYDFVSGAASGVGMMIPLYAAADGGIVVFDDCDSIFKDEEALNVLKTALDSTAKRHICWLKASSYLEKNEIPNRFDFNGSVIFLTNQDFQSKADSNTSNAQHYSALMSRSMYLDLTMRTLRDKCIRIRQIVSQGMLNQYNLTQEQTNDILSFIEDNASHWRELSLRLLHHLARMVKIGDDWQEMAELSYMR